MRPCPVLSKAAQDVRRAAVLFNFAARGARVCNRPTLGLLLGLQLAWYDRPTLAGTLKVR